jgi:hypothetical protein
MSNKIIFLNLWHIKTNDLNLEEFLTGRERYQRYNITFRKASWNSMLLIMILQKCVYEHIYTEILTCNLIIIRSQ